MRRGLSEFDYRGSGLTPTEALGDMMRKLGDRYLEERKWQERKKEIVEEVLKRIQVEVKDEASPTIRALNNEIDKLMKHR